MASTALSIDRDAVAAICRENGVARLSMFGSALREDFDPARSDVDLLVEFLPGESKSLLKLLAMQHKFAEVFGREVDLTTPASLSKYIRGDVLADAVVMYDAA
jgi:predicted nucleotidyltransferase